MHVGLERRGRAWHTAIVILAIALLGVASTAGFSHVSHGADQDCAVCQLRHQPANTLIETPLVGPADWTQSTVLFDRIDQTVFHYGHEDPTRGPPA